MLDTKLKAMIKLNSEEYLDDTDLQEGFSTIKGHKSRQHDIMDLGTDYDDDDDDDNDDDDDDDVVVLQRIPLPTQNQLVKTSMTENGYEVQIPVSQLATKQLKISASKTELHVQIMPKKPSEATQQIDSGHLVKQGFFNRSFFLPSKVDNKKIMTRYKSGHLVITVALK